MSPRTPSHPGTPSSDREVPEVAQPEQQRQDQGHTHTLPLSPQSAGLETHGSPHRPPSQSPQSLQPAFTYSPAILPWRSLRAFLTNITLWDRGNGPPQGATPRPHLPSSASPWPGLQAELRPQHSSFYCGLRA